MRRRMFATAVVLVVMATPLFGAQGTATPAAQTKAATAQQPVAAKAPPPAKATKKPEQTAGTAKPSAPAAAAPAPAKTAATSQKSAAPAPAKAAPAAPKAPVVNAAGPSPKTDARPAALVKPAPSSSKPAAATAVKSAAPVRSSAIALSPVQEKLQQNKELIKELQAKLPGADVVNAAEGFKDLPQFVATALASHNLNIPFTPLKEKLLGGKRTSLRQAIQELRPNSSAAIEAQRAQYDAAGMIRTSEQTAAAAAAEAASKSKPGTTPKDKQ